MLVAVEPFSLHSDSAKARTKLRSASLHSSSQCSTLSHTAQRRLITRNDIFRCSYAAFRCSFGQICGKMAKNSKVGFLTLFFTLLPAKRPPGGPRRRARRPATPWRRHDPD